MKTLNLGFFKRVMLVVLVGMVNLVYHTDANGYVKYTNTSNASACTSYCGNSTYYRALYATDILSAAGIGGSLEAQNHGLLPVAWSSTLCMCLTSTEYNSVLSCRQGVCAGQYVSGSSGTVASGNPAYDYVHSVCTGAVCSCVKGYYKNTASYCSICNPGYYCNGFYSILCPSGRYSSVSMASTCTPCASGYYMASSGARSCIACSTGYFQSQTGATVCGICPENTFANKVSAATSCISCYSYYPTPSGTKPSPVAGLSSLGTASVTGCYVAVGLEFTEPSGDKWAFVNNCHYAS
ncbi:MAG: hypothetical protein IKV93_01500 [Alphaproteobacteria bacterium]|nr:hypothetical protein [Alphaproteobacteria bacterium]